MIEFRNVSKRYGRNHALEDVSVHINKGDFVFLVGPSGAGKTTFIKLILKEIDPDRGRILLAGQDITKLKRRKIPEVRQKVGMVFQDFRLLEKKTVYENVAFAMEVLHKSRKEIRERVPYVLELVDILDKKDRYPEELSAGEQQRVGIARALANQPRVLICDEPTGNLDPVTAMEIMALLELINIRGTTVVMVTHAKDIVDAMNKRVVAINEGKIIADKSGGYVFHDFDTARGGEDYIPGAFTASRARNLPKSETNSMTRTETNSLTRAEKKALAKAEKKAAKEAAKAARTAKKEGNSEAQSLRASEARRTITNLSRQTLSGLQTGKSLSNLNQPAEVSDAEVDKMLSEYLSGGESDYE
ncbi:MAG: cell division ATP-binding protein FtsE [Mogibacterium sp.]|nr:cell division ATP-binding protein FtsE [Mogibacterium sp.]